MAKKLYVGNLPYNLQDEDLKELFQQHGEVVSAQIIQDRETRRSKGFGFVEMSTEAEAEAAIEALNSTEVNGRALSVSVARAKPARS